MNDQTTSSPPARRRPFGVSVIAVVMVLYGITIVLRYIGAGDIFPGGELMLPFVGNLERLFGVQLPDDSMFLLALAIASAVLMLIAASAFWRLRRWAWIFTMILVGSNMLRDVFMYSQGRARYFDMAVMLVLVFYLNQRDVQRAFGHPPPRPRITVREMM
jgi:hypothetical protein